MPARDICPILGLAPTTGARSPASLCVKDRCRLWQPIPDADGGECLIVIALGTFIQAQAQTAQAAEDEDDDTTCSACGADWSIGLSEDADPPDNCPACGEGLWDEDDDEKAEAPLDPSPASTVEVEKSPISKTVIPDGV